MEGEESGQRRVDEYTQDGTVDLKGNPVLRSKRGGWTACSFVVLGQRSKISGPAP
ncbi:hypothetical protein C1H46_006006 [Malus baccata]|uniref:Uncharacterized protein n=1 Tax=Malus baccata TaxID=106549 RepID=A0A540NBG6_MALBA|nr:hypothetical protein C1H46_006006 [Malus baccata]